MALSLLALAACSGRPASAPPAAQTKLDYAAARDRVFLRGNLPSFYKALDRLRAGRREVVRVMLFGDSIIWGDCLTVRLKRRFQTDFGDGGRGLMNIVDEPATRLLDHRNLTRGGWRRFKIPYGAFSIPPFPELGFTGFAYRPVGSAATVHRVAGRDAVQGIEGWRRRFAGHPQYALPRLGPPAGTGHGTDGEDWRRLRLVLRAPGASRAETTAIVRAQNANGVSRTLSENLSLPGASCATIDVDLPPTRRLSLAFQGASPFVDGMALESARGVSFSPVILRGLHVAWLLGVPEEQFACGYRAYDPDLIVFQFGINESHTMASGHAGFTAERYREQLRRLYTRLRKAAPESSILILGPWERMIHGRTYAAHAQAREIQKRTAVDLDQAYFDGFLYTGGTDGFLRMARAGLVQSDFTHLTFPGGHYMADALYDTLMKDYKKWRDE